MKNKLASFKRPLAITMLVALVALFLLFSPAALWDNVVWGVAPTWTDVIIGVTLAMIAYTGIETVSNMAEEAQVPERTIPASIRATVLTVLVMSLGIFSAFMLYDIKRVVDGGETNYVSATLAIYLDIYNVFQSLLSLLGIFGGDRD